MSKNNKKNMEEAKASSAANSENAKKAKHAKDNAKNAEEWLEDELNGVDLESSENDSEADEIMKKAAEELEKTKAQIKEEQDKYLRLHAEWDTYRRRIKEQREQDKAEATEGLVKDCLPVLDDFERSIDFAKNNGTDGLIDGVSAIYSKLVDAFQKSGVEVVNPEVGDEFNAIEHQAVGTVENAEVFEESVGNVLQKGYKMGKKVVRPAMVMVTTGGDQRPKEDSEENDEE